MWNAMTGPLVVAALLAPGAVAESAQVTASNASAVKLPAISAESLRAHMAVLADDAMAGRGTGTAAYDRAADYVASRFAGAGLATGVKGGWLQPVPLRTRTPKSPAQFSLGGSIADARSFRFGDEFVLTRPGSESVDLEGPVVFVGYGVTIPARAHDDYAGLDVRGKLVAFLPGAPAGLSLDERTYYAGSKLRNALAHGAIATIRLWTPGEASTERWEDAVQSYAAAGLFTWASDTAARDRARPTAEHVWLGPAASERLFAGSRVSYAEAVVTARPVSLTVRGRISLRGEVTTAASSNVVAILRGSDPVLRNEYVAVTAHLDHLGIGRPVNGDSIYNGAVDNASGVAALLEIARAFASMPDRPRRSLLFVAVAAEEPGNIGSEYFVAHPPVPLASVVANINIDGASVWAFDGMVPRGAEHSTLARTVGDAVALVGERVVPDPAPGRTSLAGSDQYTFMTAGIPAVILGTARSASARELVLAWLRDRYHAPGDDMTQPMDFNAAARFTRAVLAVVHAVALADDRPRWNAGDFFGRLAAGSAASRQK